MLMAIVLIIPLERDTWLTITTFWGMYFRFLRLHCKWHYICMDEFHDIRRGLSLAREMNHHSAIFSTYSLQCVNFLKDPQICYFDLWNQGSYQPRLEHIHHSHTLRRK